MRTRPSKHSFAISGDPETVSHVNHELKSLITSVKTYGQLLERKLQKNDPTLIPYLNKLDGQVDKLFYNIANLFDLRSLAAQTFTIQTEEIALETILNDVIHKVKKQIPDIEISLPKIPDVKIFADRNYIERALSYILQNAAEHANSKPITISIEKVNKKICITITNSQEIDSSIYPFIFTPFLYKNGEKGLGLSLYIAKNIITFHKGTVEITSNKDNTSVICTFPIS